MFFSLEGNENNEEFVSSFSRGYFFDEKNGKSNKVNLRYNQQSRPVEESVIIPILDNGMKDENDFIRALAWKIGKIKGVDIDSRSDIDYTKDWKGCEESHSVKFYKKTISLDKMAKYVIDNKSMLEKLSKENPQKCLNLLRDNSCDYVGPVYLLTILFFLSHRKHPIYDRFADASLYAYENKLKPSKEKFVHIFVRSMPQKNDRGFDTLVQDIYKPYEDRVKKVADELGVDYEDRDYDRALWVYGHGFKVSYGKGYKHELQ